MRWGRLSDQMWHIFPKRYLTAAIRIFTSVMQPPPVSNIESRYLIRHALTVSASPHLTFDNVTCSSLVNPLAQNRIPRHFMVFELMVSHPSLMRFKILSPLTSNSAAVFAFDVMNVALTWIERGPTETIILTSHSTSWQSWSSNTCCRSHSDSWYPCHFTSIE